VLPGSLEDGREELIILLMMSEDLSCILFIWQMKTNSSLFGFVCREEGERHQS
jgi:hypothetical protein